MQGHRGNWIIRACSAWLVLAWLWPCLAHAEDAPPDAALSGFDHSSWTLERGAPADIWDMFQGRDRALWLGTGSGLYRFDGQRFMRTAPPPGQAFPSNNLTVLKDDGAGGVWAGTYDAGVFHLHGQTLQRYGPEQGLPPGIAFSMARDGQGRWWVANGDGLRWFDGQRWRAPQAGQGFAAGEAYWVLCDAGGTLWVATADRLLYLPRAGQRFLDAGVPLTRYAAWRRRRTARCGWPIAGAACGRWPTAPGCCRKMRGSGAPCRSCACSASPSSAMAACGAACWAAAGSCGCAGSAPTPCRVSNASMSARACLPPMPRRCWKTWRATSGWAPIWACRDSADT